MTNQSSVPKKKKKHAYIHVLLKYMSYMICTLPQSAHSNISLNRKNLRTLYWYMIWIDSDHIIVQTHGTNNCDAHQHHPLRTLPLAMLLCNLFAQRRREWERACMWESVGQTYLRSCLTNSEFFSKYPSLTLSFTLSVTLTHSLPLFQLEPSFTLSHYLSSHYPILISLSIPSLSLSLSLSFTFAHAWPTVSSSVNTLLLSKTYQVSITHPNITVHTHIHKHTERSSHLLCWRNGRIIGSCGFI